MGWNLPEQVRLQADAVEAEAIGELQLNWMQSGSSSRSGRNQGTELLKSGKSECKWQAAPEGTQLVGSS